MGVTGLYDYIRKHCPQCIKDVSLSDLVKGYAAMDGHFFAFKLLTQYGRNVDRILFSLTRDFNKLKAAGIIPVVVFDGTDPVPEKVIARLNRKRKTENSKEDLEIVRSRFLQFLENKTVKPHEAGDPEWLHEVIEGENYLTKISSLEKTTQCLDGELITLLIEGLEKKGIICFRAYEEGDFVMSHLYKEGKVNYVFTDDGDAFAFGVGKVVRNISKHLNNPTGEKLQMYDLSIMLKKLKMTQDDFIQFCTLSKCDYTPEKAVYGIGSVKAYKAIKEHKTVKKYLKTLSPDKYDERFPQCARAAIKLFKNPRSKDYIFSVVENGDNTIFAKHSPLREIIHSYL